MNIGDPVKVFLPGESPWAQVTAIRSDEHIEARILNDLWNTDGHGRRKGDVIDFELTPVAISGAGVFWNWHSVPTLAEVRALEAGRAR